MLNAEVSFEIKFVLNFQVADKNNKTDNNNNQATNNNQAKSQPTTSYIKFYLSCDPHHLINI